MSQSLGRVIQSVVTHNRLQECEVMWQQHRHQQAHEQERGGEERDSRTAAARDTLASIEQARDAAAARKLAARSAVKSIHEFRVNTPKMLTTSQGHTTSSTATSNSVLCNARRRSYSAATT